MSLNRQFRLARRPVGLPRREDFEVTSEETTDPGEGQFLVKIAYLSLDPAMRGWMNAGRSYLPPVGIGEVMRASGVGEVVASRHPEYPVGASVAGVFGIQQYALSDGTGVTVVDPTLAPLPTYLDVLGTSGLTAYFGLFDVGQPKAGDTVVVSGAAGAVGAVVGQLAKIAGCRVVGIAGGPDKCRQLVDELGFDAAIDYKFDDVATGLRQHCPDGVDVYFDNVGGAVLDAVLTRLGRGARVVICGAISQYNSTSGFTGPSNYMMLLVTRSTMAGFVVFDYADRYHEATAKLTGWLTEGTLLSRVHVVETGFETFPETLLMLFSGQNTGKLVLAAS